MAAAEQYVPDSDDEMGPDTSGDEMDDIEVVLTPQEWKSKAGDLYKVRWFLGRSLLCRGAFDQVEIFRMASSDDQALDILTFLLPRWVGRESWSLYVPHSRLYPVSLARWGESSLLIAAATHHATTA